MHCDPVGVARRGDVDHFTVDDLPADHFQIHIFTGKESLSESYALDVIVTSDATR